jgi:hypothetical protein
MEKPCCPSISVAFCSDLIAIYQTLMSNTFAISCMS